MSDLDLIYKIIFGVVGTMQTIILIFLKKYIDKVDKIIDKKNDYMLKTDCENKILNCSMKDKYIDIKNKLEEQEKTLNLINITLAEIKVELKLIRKGD